MKFYGLLGLLFSILSLSAIAEGQVVSPSVSQDCPTCSQAVNFAAVPVASEPAYVEGTVVDGTQVQSQPIYQDTSVVPTSYVEPAIYAAPQPGTVVNQVTEFPQSAPIVGQPINQNLTPMVATNANSGLAQSKATTAAQMGLRGHLGGGLGNAKYEGVGWSSQSPQSAIEHCCYWGTRPVAQIGVAKGNDGCWYACVLYQ